MAAEWKPGDIVFEAKTSQWSFYVEEEQEVSDRCARPEDPDKKFALKTPSASSFFYSLPLLSRASTIWEHIKHLFVSYLLSPSS